MMEIDNNSSWPVFQKARAMFSSCQNMDANESRDAMKALNQFLSSRSLPSPDIQNGSSAHPLDVLLDLAINWQLPLWFTIGVFQIKSDNRVGVLFSPEFYRVFGEEAIYGILYNGQTRQARSRTGRVLSTAIPHQPNQTDEYEIDREIPQALRGIAGDRYAQMPDVVRILDIERFTPKLTSDVWLTLLNKHLSPNFRLGLKDQILVTDTRLLKTINRFFEKYGHAKILGHLHRRVLEVFSNMAVSDALYPENPLIVEPHPTSREISCEMQIEDVYKLLLSVAFYDYKQLSKHRSMIDDVLGSVAKTTVELIKDSPYIAKEDKERLVHKTRNTSILLWSRDELLTPPGLEKVFASFPTSESTFFDYVLQTRNVTRALLGSEAYDDITAPPHGGRESYVKYNAFKNAVTLSLAAFKEPLYYSDGTKSINYGGIASTFARELIQTLNTPELSANATGWYFQGKPDASGMLRCNDTLTDKPIFPEVPALEVAYRAYSLNQRVPVGKDLRLPSMEEYSEEQVFFISFCRTTCRLVHDRKTSEVCNTAVRNVEAFARAFNCTPESKMNPTVKCRVFT